MNVWMDASIQGWKNGRIATQFERQINLFRPTWDIYIRNLTHYWHIQNRIILHGRHVSAENHHVIIRYFFFYLIFGLGSSSAFCPLEALQPVWLMPEVYCTIPRISNRPYSNRQVTLASTTRGIPPAATGGTMGGNSGQMMPEICTQGSLTCRNSATWDR
jgi:hypothetical protein